MNAGRRKPLRLREDWPARLDAFLVEAQRRPFAWGRRHDCALFLAGALKATTGTDPARGFRGRYRSAAGALRMLAEYLGRSPGRMTLGLGLELFAAKMAAEFGMIEVPILRARRSAAVFIDVPTEGGESRPALGVCIGARVAVAALAGGYETYPLAAARRAWEVA